MNGMIQHVDGKEFSTFNVATQNYYEYYLRWSKLSGSRDLVCQRSADQLRVTPFVLSLTAPTCQVEAKDVVKCPRSLFLLGLFSARIELPVTVC